jgi:hypothetical protein
MKKTGMITRVNKGLRVWLFEGGTLAQQTDFSSVTDGRKTVAELFQLMKTLERKSFLEEQYFLPVITLRAPYAISLLEEEKKQVKEQTVRLTRSLEKYLQPGTDGHYRVTGLCIQQNYMEFLSHMLIYLNRQESLFNGLVTTDHGMDSANQMNLAEDHAMEFTTWMLKGMNNREIFDWLESDLDGSLTSKRRLLETLSPQRMQAAGLIVYHTMSLVAA